jgi:hypothetical protein
VSITRRNKSLQLLAQQVDASIPALTTAPVDRVNVLLSETEEQAAWPVAVMVKTIFPKATSAAVGVYKGIIAV